jgi:hypothetical protein
MAATNQVEDLVVDNIDDQQQQQPPPTTTPVQQPQPSVHDYVDDVTAMDMDDFFGGWLLI